MQLEFVKLPTIIGPALEINFVACDRISTLYDSSFVCLFGRFTPQLQKVENLLRHSYQSRVLFTSHIMLQIKFLWFYALCERLVAVLSEAVRSIVSYSIFWPLPEAVYLRQDNSFAFIHQYL